MTSSRRLVLGVAALSAVVVAVTGVSGQNPNNPKGLDVSMWQGTINWTNVKSAGIDFVIIRAGHGDMTGKDTKFDANWPAAKAAGLVRGAYWYVVPSASPTLAANAQKIATVFVETVQPKRDDLQLCIDLEDNGGLSRADLWTWLQACTAKVKALTGRPAIIYCSPGFWSGNLPTTGTNNMNCGLWVAHWGAVSPTIPGPWASTGYAFWQYSSTGNVAGLNPVDQDTYNGSMSSLMNFTYPRDPLNRK
jgi:GH25 family lysozyme M1 (1,4-beta-N-acetylmuramidase)